MVPGIKAKAGGTYNADVGASARPNACRSLRLDSYRNFSGVLSGLMLFACQTCLFTDSLSKKGIEISLIPHLFSEPGQRQRK